MAKNPVIEYLDRVPQPQRRTLQAVRKAILSTLPHAEECIAYSMPAYKVDGTTVAGFASYKNHCSYFPHSGSVIPALGKTLARFDADAGTLRFPVDTPLPLAVVRKLVAKRLELESKKVTKAGKLRAFYDNGAIKYRGQRKGGEMHGKWYWYRKDGSLMRSGSFKLGKQCGTWSTWDRNEKLVKETKFPG